MLCQTDGHLASLSWCQTVVGLLMWGAFWGRVCSLQLLLVLAMRSKSRILLSQFESPQTWRAGYA
jgi:hypothetical protein